MSEIAEHGESALFRNADYILVFMWLVFVAGPLNHRSTPKKTVCPHPGFYAGMCVKCGQKLDDESGVAFGYIHKNLRLANDEVARLRNKDLKNLLRNRKLYLVLDLDHTLLNSARLSEITVEEGYLKGQRDALPDTLKSSLFKLDQMQMMTKLRPFVNTLLKEANNLFEMYIYTMGERPYALEMAKLLDPGDIYFNSRIIAQGDCTQRHRKGLDVVLGQESAVVILDDTEAVWGKHTGNLILMERYHFFASSCKHFGFNCKSLSELKSDESETEGALATVLKILQRIHTLFFDETREDNLKDRDVRQVLKNVRKEVLKDCTVVFSRVFPTNFPAKHHALWKMAEELGAKCSIELNPSVTHVVSTDAGTYKSRWAVQEKRYLVHPRWIEAANYMWRKQPEENFPKGADRIANCLVARVLSTKLINRDTFRQHLPRIIQATRRINIEVVGENLFILEFLNPIDRRRALGGGLAPLQQFDSFPGVKRVQILESLDFSTWDVWIQCHNIHVAYMQEEIIQRIGDMLGTMIKIDKGDREVFFGEIRRIKIRLGIDQTLQRHIILQENEGSGEIFVLITYEKLLDFCYAYGKVGHTWRECGEAEKMGTNMPYRSWLRASLPMGRNKKKPGGET
ncbi:hypothetical protein DH2020_014242 [Rehmannia glutinosa]|uniref:RNA polymerase II C-terminal domain phosphatase-like n=1 Tax=Rehmannia glutinosa TaxID=99300 RepID=A0ABR0WVU4_REHGL